MKLSIRNKILLGFGVVLLTCAVSIVISFFAIQANISNFDSFIQKDVYNLKLADEIRYEDISLTDCVRGIIINPNNSKDRKQYDQLAASIDQKIKEASKFAHTDEEKRIFDENDKYNQQLIQMETLMMSSTDKDKVLAVFDGEYARVRQLFADNLNRFKAIQDHNMAAKVNQLKKDMNFRATLILAFFGISLLLGIICSLFIAQMISKPIKQMAEAADKLAIGDVNVQINVKSKDEIGSLVESFKKMIENIREQALAIEKIAFGDLTADVKVKSEFDLLGQKLKEMLATNNEVLGNINSAAEQVAAGAQHVAQASQMLSQGSTEQAASLEEITSSMTEVAAQTRQNAVNANKANELEIIVKDSAIDGNQQMKGMLKAMEEINDSSANISKIIKVIDEIAFQTNILALNAAVEAARAGQHGKGFAVVAEEVRNLAARSANAAKETTALIEGSIKKVEAGTRIANETAIALNKIVENVSEVTNLVADIAAASNQQASGIGQINQGIEQVSQVTQSNTATSEESAAASEELSSQAQLLKSMVARFKIRSNPQNLPQLNSLSPEVLKALEEISSLSNSKVAGSRTVKYEAAVSDENPKLKINLDDNEFGKY